MRSILLLWLWGVSACGAIVNGPVTRVKLVRAAPDHDYRIDGSTVPRNVDSVLVPNNKPTTIKVIAPDGSTAEMQTEIKVSAGAIVGDVLWSLTILGIAAPIADLAVGAFTYASPSTVALVPKERPQAIVADSLPARPTEAAGGPPTAPDGAGAWGDLSFTPAPGRAGGGPAGVWGLGVRRREK